MPADDTCQIVALLGRALQGWGTASQFAIFYRPDGNGYVEQCPWAEMGIKALPPGQPDMDNMRYFTAPRYAEGGLAAEVAFVTKLIARDPAGRPRPPYINQVNLTVRKVDGVWTMAAQRQGPVT